MRLDTSSFRVAVGDKVRLEYRPTRAAPVYTSKGEYDRLLRRHVKAIAGLHRVLYAVKQAALLVVVQGMDASGKDGAIRHVMSGVGPQGCQVHGFGPPSTAELEHDFLWRCSACLPRRGWIGIFNRSYYEDVLVARVHPELLGREGLSVADDRSELWQERFRSIVAFEAHLVRNNTRIVKVFLHLSKEEQRKRFLLRIDNPAKTWKIGQADLTDRARWDDYVRAYEACLGATSTDQAPWYVVPADDKKAARLIISRVVLDALEDLRLSYPQPNPEQRGKLDLLREQLDREGKST